MWEKIKERINCKRLELHTVHALVNIKIKQLYNHRFVIFNS